MVRKARFGLARKRVCRDAVLMKRILSGADLPYSNLTKMVMWGLREILVSSTMGVSFDSVSHRSRKVRLV